MDGLTLTVNTWIPDGWDDIRYGIECAWNAQNKLLDRLWDMILSEWS